MLMSLPVWKAVSKARFRLFISISSSCGRPVATRPTIHHTPSFFVVMKRTVTTANLPNGGKLTKKPKPSVPEYHLTPSVRDEDGAIVWPAPDEKMEAARAFIREWYAALHIPPGSILKRASFDMCHLS